MALPPAVNIVLSYDPQAMMNFREKGSFAEFAAYQNTRDERLKQEAESRGQTYNPNTYIFNNSPNSTFLSLEHQFGGDGDTRLEIDIVDPQGMFESAMLDNKLSGQLDIASNPIQARLDTLQNEANETTSELTAIQEALRAVGTESDPTLNRLRQEHEITTVNLEAKLQALEESIADIDELSALERVNAEGAMLQTQMDSQLSQMQRPVYITYGIGNDFKNWAPVQCFGKIIKIEYSFTGTGVRKLKLKFSGKSIHPNLMRGFGVAPLGSDFTQGLLAKGLSHRLFNEESAAAEATAFNELYPISSPGQGNFKASRTLLGITYPGQSNARQAERFYGRWDRPSLHLIVKNALTDLIKRASNYNNVLVIMPDLDYWLDDYKDDCMDNTSWSESIGDAWDEIPDAVVGFREKYRGWAEALNGLGLHLATVPDDNKYTGAVGEVQEEYIEECDSPQEIQNWLNSQVYKGVAECDFTDSTFVKKINQIGEAIGGKLTDYNEGEEIAVSFMNDVVVETDLEMIRIMYNHGLIPDDNKPVVLWGDRNMRDNILYAKLLEKTGAQIQAIKDPENEEEPAPLTQSDLTNFAQDHIRDYVHPIDELMGLNLEYMQDVLDYQIPAESWVGPFGPMYSGGEAVDEMLANDTNLNAASRRAISGNPNALRMPLFTFGTKNPNIMGIDIDLNGVYVAAMNSAAPVGMGGQAGVAGIIPPNFQGTATNLFVSMEAMDTEDVDSNGVPKEFKNMMAPYLQTNTIFNDEIVEFDGWSEAFANLGEDSEFANIADTTFDSDQVNFGGSELLSGEEKFYIFMWEAFQALYTATFNTPLMDREEPSRGGGPAAIARSARIASTINESALSGKITTVPLFSLSTDRRVLNRPCVIQCIEPAFIQSPNGLGPKANRAWFSGIYNMLGFVHKISGGSCESQFFVARAGAEGLSNAEGAETDS